MTTGLFGSIQVLVSASSGLPSYQPMYSFCPITSSASVSGSSCTTVVPLPLGLISAEVMGRVLSSFLALLARLVRKVVRSAVLGVSFDTDQKITDALFRSRRIISFSISTALAYTSGLSKEIPCHRGISDQ